MMLPGDLALRHERPDCPSRSQLSFGAWAHIQVRISIPLPILAEADCRCCSTLLRVSSYAVFVLWCYSVSVLLSLYGTAMSLYRRPSVVLRLRCTAFCEASYGFFVLTLLYRAPGENRAVVFQ
eukprot:2232229-Rhodomonas_salina.1